MSANPIKASIRYSVYERDSYTCQYCGLNIDKKDIGNLTIDHIVTKSSGGLHHEDNLRTSCRICNSRRGEKSIEEFRFLMRMYKAGIGGVISISQAQELLRRGVDLGLPNDHQFYFELDKLR